MDVKMGESRDRALERAFDSDRPTWKGPVVDNKWDYRFLGLAEHIAQWSKDPSTKVGAVLVDDQRIIRGLGYNGFPRGVKDTLARLENRQLKYPMIVHAEVNAILMAGDKAKDCKLYVWPAFGIPPVCSECCKVIIQAGVKAVIGLQPDPDDEKVKRWAESLEISKTMLTESGVGFYGIPRPDISSN